jgi:protein phosphatase
MTGFGDNVTNMDSKHLPLTAGALTEAGRREQNQDRMSAFSSPFGAVYMVADGMGGHKGGAVAAQMVVDGFERNLAAIPPASVCTHALALAGRQTNAEVIQRSSLGDQSLAGMGSTLAVALIRDLGGSLELVAANVGDSRVYLHRHGTLRQLTKDHTQVQALVDNHIIDEEAARHHPDASVLTRAIGQSMDLAVDVTVAEPLLDGDGILICSDGLSGFAAGDAINRTILANPDPFRCAGALYDLAMASGSNDNITVQFIRIGNSPPPVISPVTSSRRTAPDQPAGPLPMLAPRPTLPDQPVVAFPPRPSAPIAAHPADRHGSLKLLLAGLVIGLGISGGVGAFIFRDRLFPKRPAVVKRNPLQDKVAALDSGATKENREALDGVTAADRMLKDCAELPEPPKKAALHAERSALVAKIKGLRSGYQDVGDATVDLLNEVTQYREDLRTLPKDDTKSGDVLPKRVETSTANLAKYRGQLAKLQPDRDNLEKSVSKLREEWNRK